MAGRAGQKSREAVTNNFRHMLTNMGRGAMEAIALGVPRQLALEAAGRAALDLGTPEAVCAYCPSLALAWAENGFSTVEPAHRLAASLMATTIPQEYVEAFVRMPWRCFGFHVPNGLLGKDEGFCLALHARGGTVHMISIVDQQFHYGIEESLAGWNCKVVDSRVVDGVVEDGIPADFFSPRSVGRTARVTELMGRLFLGVCTEMSGHRQSESGPSATGCREHTDRSQDRRLTSTFKLTRDVNVDVRRAVRDYVEGRTALEPSVQVLVRGHWKMQVYGLGRADRKLIHVEPYWRGPEEGPVAVRAHKIGAS